MLHNNLLPMVSYTYDSKACGALWLVSVKEPLECLFRKEDDGIS